MRWVRFETGQRESSLTGQSEDLPPKAKDDGWKLAHPNPGQFARLGNLGMLILLLKIAALCPSLPIELADWGKAMQSYHSAYATS